MFRGHCIAIYRGRLYDAAEMASMPYEGAFLDRCIREHANDKDRFGRFHRVVVLRPTELLRKALSKKRKSVQLEHAAGAASSSMDSKKAKRPAS